MEGRIVKCQGTKTMARCKNKSSIQQQFQQKNEKELEKPRISVGESWDEIAILSVIQNKQEADMTACERLWATKLKRVTETKIVKEDAKANEKSEVEVIDIDEDEKSEVEVIDIDEDEKSEVEVIDLEEETLAEDIPEDVIEVKSDFARLHIWRGNRSHIRILLTKMYSIGGFLEYNSYYKEPIQRIDFPAQFSGCTKILGSADGLAFLLDGVAPFACGIFNPSTEKCLRVQLSPPPPFYAPYFYWFGDIDGTGEYILVMGLSVPPRKEIWVYKFSRNSNIMNRIRSIPFWFKFPLDSRGTLVQGVLHWPLHPGFTTKDYVDRHKILAYDFGKNEAKEISCPRDVNVRLGLSVDGCSLLATSGKSIWIMKDGRWTKFADVEVSTDKNFSTLLDPLGFLPDGDLIMEVNLSRLMRYSFTRKEATLLYEYGRYGNGERMHGAIVCADTLLSPGCC